MATKQQLLKPGDVVYSVCGGFVYQIKSYPVCRIYYDYSPNAKYLLSYHELENLSAEDKQKGIKHRHLSYLATMYNSTLLCNGAESLFYVTDNGLRLFQSVSIRFNPTPNQRGIYPSGQGSSVASGKPFQSNP